MERDNASLELIELIQSKRSIEECMEAMSKDVKSKQEELNLFAVCVNMLPTLTWAFIPVALLLYAEC